MRRSWINSFSVLRRCYTVQFSQRLVSLCRCDISCWRIARCNMWPLQLVSTFSLRATLHEVELSPTFCNDCSNFQSPLHSATLPSSNLCRNALLDQPVRILIILSSVLLGQSGSPIAQCNTLFVKLQWYAFKPCETSCTKNCLYAAVFPVRLSHSSCDVLSLLWKLQKLLLLLLLFCS